MNRLPCRLFECCAQVTGTLVGAVLGGIAFAYADAIGTHFLFVPLGLAQWFVMHMHDRVLRPAYKLSPALSEPLAPISS